MTDPRATANLLSYAVELEAEAHKLEMQDKVPPAAVISKTSRDARGT